MQKINLSPAVRQQLPRLVTGLSLAVILVVCLVLGGAFLAVALAVVSALALFEFFQLFWPGKTRIPTKVFGILACLMLFCPVGGAASVPVILVLTFVWAGMAFLVDFGRGNNTADLATQSTLPLGILYIPVVLHLALSLTLREQFLVVAAAIASDTAAYYVGCAFGKRRIWPRVSPKKSWEGSIAGFAATIAVTTAIACIPFGSPSLHGGGIVTWIFIGAFLNLAAQFGDFFESALKRSRGVKDSGGILPGHGGILDRIDSILFTLAAYAVIMLACTHITLLGKIFLAA